MATEPLGVGVIDATQLNKAEPLLNFVSLTKIIEQKAKEKRGRAMLGNSLNKLTRRILEMYKVKWRLTMQFDGCLKVPAGRLLPIDQ
jgi:uncharacterized membrane protein